MWLAVLIVLQLHHVKHVALGLLGSDLAASVVRADDVQVVINAHVHGIIIPEETGGREERKKKTTMSDCQ